MFRIAYSVFLCKMILRSGGDHSKKHGVQIRHSDAPEQTRGVVGFLPPISVFSLRKSRRIRSAATTDAGIY